MPRHLWAVLLVTGCAGERPGNWLRKGSRVTSRFGRAHRFGLHLDVILAGRTEFRSWRDRAERWLSTSHHCRQKLRSVYSQHGF
jgi:hypothetical protein